MNIGKQDIEDVIQSGLGSDDNSNSDPYKYMDHSHRL